MQLRDGHDCGRHRLVWVSPEAQHSSLFAHISLELLLRMTQMKAPELNPPSGVSKSRGAPSSKDRGAGFSGLNSRTNMSRTRCNG